MWAWDVPVPQGLRGLEREHLVQYARVSGFVVLHFGQYQVILLDVGKYGS